MVIKRQGHGVREPFTVRKHSFGVGVERTFPLHSPKIERIEVAARGDVRRAKLYYLRGRVGKRARVRERRSVGPEVAVERELLYGPDGDGTPEAVDADGVAQDEAPVLTETAEEVVVETPEPAAEPEPEAAVETPEPETADSEPAEPEAAAAAPEATEAAAAEPDAEPADAEPAAGEEQV